MERGASSGLADAAGDLRFEIGDFKAATLRRGNLDRVGSMSIQNEIGSGERDEKIKRPIDQETKRRVRSGPR